MNAPAVIVARCDGGDRLVEADEPLAGLQRRCGGDLPGLIAIPELLALVRRSRGARLPLARRIVAADDGARISAWAAAEPEGEGTRIELSHWRRAADETAGEEVDAALARQLARAVLLLDDTQRVLAADARDPALEPLVAAARSERGAYWTALVRLDPPTPATFGAAPLHWRLLDNARFSLDPDGPHWRACILPRSAGGLELLVLPDETAVRVPDVRPAAEIVDPLWNGLFGRDLAPALRQPVNRIIANAETIRTRLAGPIADEYAGYAADIADAGRHLLGLVEDLADLEAVEAPGFAPAPDHIDLVDCARRAAGILAVRARERGMTVDVPDESCVVPAIGEFRRVLQVLLNLLGNALRYGPAGSIVRLEAANEGEWARVSVSDEGQGLTADEAARVFDKFERLGRSGDGGSGLGLYISRRLARAMKGDLSVTRAAGGGACFTLSLPADR